MRSCGSLRAFMACRARVFGSVLRGTDTDQSDLDLLVDPAESTGLLTLAAFKIDAEKLLGVPVSVLNPNALPPKFRSEVLRQARRPSTRKCSSRRVRCRRSTIPLSGMMISAL